MRHSFALTLSMRAHTTGHATWRWRRDPAPVERILRRVADERLQLVTSGASDWLEGSGVAVRVANSHVAPRGSVSPAAARLAIF